MSLLLLLLLLMLHLLLLLLLQTRVTLLQRLGSVDASGRGRTGAICRRRGGGHCSQVLTLGASLGSLVR